MCFQHPITGRVQGKRRSVPIMPCFRRTNNCGARFAFVELKGADSAANAARALSGRYVGMDFGVLSALPNRVALQGAIWERVDCLGWPCW